MCYITIKKKAMNRLSITNTVIMIKPLSFCYNLDTASDNSFQKNRKNLSPLVIAQKAQDEFDNFVRLLKNNDISVIDFIDDLDNNTPDSLYPNNWFSTHANGTIYLYPMFAPNRRKERRKDIIDFLKKNFYVKKVIDETKKHESNNQFLEGTGSMVLDRENQLAYACLSKRTNKDLFQDWCAKMNFSGYTFLAKDTNVIYHTNVVMSICQHIVFICLDAVVEERDKKHLLFLFTQSGKKVINISISQMNSFLGNVLELKNQNGESCLIMSTSAYNSLNSSQVEIIDKYSTILHSPLDTIEYFGGGSARCMIAEVFLQPIQF